MKLVFELSMPGRGCDIVPKCDVPEYVPASARGIDLMLPEVSENDLSRHYTELAKNAFGVNDGFYPLGSCTMKYNPKVNEEVAALKGFTNIHPLQPAHTAQGCLEVIKTSEELLCEITGMDAMTLQPAAGAHGEFTGLLLIKKYHETKGDDKRVNIIVPDSAHGTNPASAVMAGFKAINVPSNDEGCVDLDALRALIEKKGADTIAGLMLTNPNTVGIFDKNIIDITSIIHEAGGLCYYDGANLNAVMGYARPGDMGFDVVHLNLHKTFSTPHGGGGPGAGPCGCKAHLADFLPGKVVEEVDGQLVLAKAADSIGSMKEFYGNFTVVVKALAYVLTLGKEGIPEASANAVLNANYMMNALSDIYNMAYDGICMHEFVMDLSNMHHDMGVSALDVAKTLLDYGMHPPTMYFPLIVHEALMIEPTETESKQTLDAAIEAYREIYERAKTEGEYLNHSPHKQCIGRPDEVKAARQPIVVCTKED